MACLDISCDYQIDYVAESGKKTTRLISPIRNFHYHGKSYTEAYCHLRGSIRTFKNLNITTKLKLGSKTMVMNSNYPEANWPDGSEENQKKNYQKEDRIENFSFREQLNEKNVSNKSKNGPSTSETIIKCIFVVAGILLIKSCMG